MLLSRADCIELYGSDYQIDQQIKAGHLFKIEKGIYADEHRVPEQAVIAFKYPQSIMTMTTAFYIHGLTDIIPERYDLATDRDESKIRDPRVHQYFMPHDFLKDGAETSDMCYLSQKMDKERLMRYIDIYIFSDSGMRENDIEAIIKRVKNTFSNAAYRRQIERSRKTNWMGVPVTDAMNAVIEYLSTL